MKKRKVDPWFPFWIDKWLFGSTRIELAPDERSVFVDLISLSKKDDGYVRANEGVPYLDTQLCGLLNVSTELFHRTVEMCIKYGKTKRLKDGTLYMTSHDIYKLSERQERRIEKEMSEESDTMSEKPDAILYNNKENKSKENNNKENKNTKGEWLAEFNEFWDAYDHKINKQDALNAYLALKRKGIPKSRIVKALSGYHNYLKHKQVNDNFNQQKMYPSTFLRQERWEQYENYKYKPRL